jgi:hypothetical protein
MTTNISSASVITAFLVAAKTAASIAWSASPPLSKPPRCWKMGRVERMIWQKVFWFQATAEPLFKASDAEASAPTFEPGRAPDFIRDRVDFRFGGVCARGLAMEGKSQVNFLPVREAGRGVDAAIHTEPRFGTNTFGARAAGVMT